MKNNIKEDLAIRLVNYILETNSTIRATAVKFNISKTQVSYLIRSNYIPENLKSKLDHILKHHFKHKHISGGLKTKELYSIKKMSKKDGE